jgi:hypothetical protein
MNDNKWMLKLFEKIIVGLLTLIMGIIAWQSSKWSETFESLTTNVAQLNTKMEVIVNEISHTAQKFGEIKSKDDEQDTKLADHETRIRIIETQGKRHAK